MLEVVQFDNDKYGLRNRVTGIILVQEEDKSAALEFDTIEAAEDHADKVTQELNDLIKEINTH